MIRTILAWLALQVIVLAQPKYDLLLTGGHVIDPKNSISGVMDVAIADGKIARVAPRIDASDTRRVVDVKGLYVTPGLIDIHVHLYNRPGPEPPKRSVSIHPDAFSFRTGVTTMVDAGTTGWRDFPDLRQRVIDRARTRVLAFLNIVGPGMGSGQEDDPQVLDDEAAAKMAKAHPDVIVGFKTAHYNGPGWEAVDQLVKAGNRASLPVMVDFGHATEQRNIRSLLTSKVRPGDIYTHCYSGLRQELLPDGKINPAMLEGRKRGVFFDLGHGGGSFFWNIAVPMTQQKFFPDSISTDMHHGSINGGMKDLLHTMSKVLLLGASFDDVIRMVTSNPAREIRRPQLGNLDVGATADIAVLRVDRGRFGFADSAGARNTGSESIVCEMTFRQGRTVWDLNARSSEEWKTFNYRKRTPAH